MRAYASISPLFWTRGSGKRLRGDSSAQVVALYLMSSPSTSMVGIFHLAIPTLCHETGLSMEEASKGLARCSEEHIAYWDEAEELVFVPALAKHQLGDELKAKDHRVKGVLRALAPFKGHRFYLMFIDRYADAYQLSDDTEQAPSKPLARGDVPVLSCPDPISSPRSGSSPQVDPVSGVQPRDITTLASSALRDRVGTEMVHGDSAKWIEVQAVCASFRATYGRTDEPRHGGDSRAQVILARLAEGYSVAQLVQAVERSKLADFMAKRSNQSLNTILKDGSRVEKFAALTEAERSPPRPRRGGPPQPDHGKTGWEGQDQ